MLVYICMDKDGKNTKRKMVKIMEIFDNIKMAELAILLNENTVLKRFYPLIPICDELAKKLILLDITDKYGYLKRTEASILELSKESGIDLEVLKLLESFLHLYDFKNRRLCEIESVNPDLMEALNRENIKTSKDYLMLCLSNREAVISKRYHADVSDVIKLFDLCDLMRLPGVKSIRADLYYDCHYKNLHDFSLQNDTDMKEVIGRYIRNNSVSKSVPFKKELATQIAVAKVLPHISFGCAG